MVSAKFLMKNSAEFPSAVFARKGFSGSTVDCTQGAGVKTGWGWPCGHLLGKQMSWLGGLEYHFQVSVEMISPYSWVMFNDWTFTNPVYRYRLVSGVICSIRKYLAIDNMELPSGFLRYAKNRWTGNAGT